MTWVNFITNDIAKKLSAGKLSDNELTLQSLCAEYNVSITPVRKAVDILIARGILVKQKNNRLKFTSRRNIKLDKVENKAQPPIDLYEKVSKELVLESLGGIAHFLREDATAKKYQTGRTVIRRIFNRLAGEGIIEHVPRCGWRLRPFNKEDLTAFLQVREVLELKALELAKEHLDTDILKTMLEKNVIAKTNIHADNSIHSYLIEQSQNRYIKDFFEHYGKYYEILFMCEDTDLPSRELAARQHRKIIDALINRNWRAARKALIEHIHVNHFVLNNKPELILSLMGMKK
jgi:DNA-binding GntR family transcriptional regulator